jgi:hypothetical protein
MAVQSGTALQNVHPREGGRIACGMMQSARRKHGMRTTALILTLGLLLTGCGGSNPASDPGSRADTDGWIVLFDGSSLDQWDAIGDANWMLGNGAVEATAGSGFLVSRESFEDFELRLEFWVTDDANSGVFIRCDDPTEVTAGNSFEVNIYDQRPDPTYRTGGIVDLAAPMAAIDAGGQWNTYEITAHGPHLVVRLNGTLTVDTMSDAHPRGPVALQYAAGTVRFRNVQVRRLGEAAPPAAG